MGTIWLYYISDTRRVDNNREALIAFITDFFLKGVYRKQQISIHVYKLYWFGVLTRFLRITLHLRNMSSSPV